ncbi:MAG: uroporphyrinogen decarboxylase [Myxococcota bacterium]
MGHLLIDAALGKPVPRTPIWIMRQAGRYQAEYQALRAKYTFLELCHSPELAAEVSLIPDKLLGIDGIIVFCDILVPLEAMGMGLSFQGGKGPVLSNPVRTRSDINALKPYDANVKTAYLPGAISNLVAEVGDRLPVLGFAGAPYTLACYAIEGQGSRHWGKAKKMMMGDPVAWDMLMTKLSDAVADLLIAQIEAGASLVQIFDTWAGDLMPDQYRNKVAPYTKRIIEKVKRPGVPVVHFMNGIAGKINEVVALEPDVISIDWRIDIGEVRRQLGPDVVLQGNLDPSTLYAPHDVIEERAKAVLDANAGGPHVFNLGHGILPDIPVAAAKHLVETVQRISVK